MTAHLHEKGEREFNRKRALWPFLKRIFTISFRYKKWMWFLGASTAIVALADGLFPLFWLKYIDQWITPSVEAFQQNQTVSSDGFLTYGLLFIGLFLCQALGIGGFIFASGRLKEHVIFDLRNQMFDRLQYLSHSFYDHASIGHLAIRLTSDAKKVSQVISWGLVELVFGVMMITVSLTAMFIFNWQLSLIVMLSIPILLVLAIKVRTSLIRYARKARFAYSQMAAYLTEHINGLEVNKTTVQEERVSETFQEVSSRLRHASYRSSVYASLYYPIVVVSGSIAAALVVYLGGNMVIEGYTGVTIGVLAAFFGYARLIFEPIFDITRFYASAQDSLSAGERIFSLIDEPISVFDRVGVTDFLAIRGEIECKDLDFAYTEGEYIFRNFNLKIPSGQSVALVGATGSGKTTLSSLVARFYEPTAGELRIDGVDYRKRTLESFRKQLGIIQQTPHLFSGTFRENLKYGQLEATDEEIKRALASIGAGEFGERLDEEVGEEGNNLSLGEKQVISFARALLKNPKILIMDEATSSVDTIAEMQIQQGIDQMISGRTSIIIAHRLSTIRNCDRILVMEKGKIIEDGSHEELIAFRGHYYGLFTHQARKAEV